MCVTTSGDEVSQHRSEIAVPGTPIEPGIHQGTQQGGGGIKFGVALLDIDPPATGIEKAASLNRNVTRIAIWILEANHPRCCRSEGGSKQESGEKRPQFFHQRNPEIDGFGFGCRGCIWTSELLFDSVKMG